MPENDFPEQKTSESNSLPFEKDPQIALNLQHIEINGISGPLVIFFGPRNIGKTVTLLRLCTHIAHYDIRPDETFRTDDQYQDTIKTFEEVRRNLKFAPSATGNINFLLLNVTHMGSRFCQILEAPGEHFFDEENPGKDYPVYLNKIINSDYRKVYVIFFSLDMFKKDQDKFNYTSKIGRLLRERVNSKRDRVVIVCNKADLQPFMNAGKPVEREFRDALYKQDTFRLLYDTLEKGGFGHIPFVPFSAGSFIDDGEGKFAFALSDKQYPARLWQEIHNSIEGKAWWKIW
ncbi:hypothetical protein LZD49_32265 [Dyadobacter sp. CY261]|uniref:hypothetical protein n=1 Tax=Dyadobacter sp. CY261 TaxID=2907203 RepID=UPI001F37FC0C|nr:hypothetical protein [Dyadobacter sp. CY261]MCF0075202.1 hypothetical protein [Dyadobacter sp. CY261]